MKTSDIKLKNLYGPCHDKKHPGMWRLEATNSKAYKLVTRAELEYLLKLPYSIEEHRKGSGNFVARPYAGKGKQGYIRLEKLLAEAALAGAAEEVGKETSINTPAVKEKVMTAADLIGRPMIKLWRRPGTSVPVIYPFEFGCRDVEEYKKEGKLVDKYLLTEKENAAFQAQLRTKNARYKSKGGKYSYMTPKHEKYTYWRNKILAQ